jgi:uncharacterized protein YjbI with pentapeptide repeats
MEFYNQTFDQATNLPTQWAYQDFEQCIFNKLDLSNVVFANANFTNCRFENCHLSKVSLNNTKLDDVTFLGCNLTHVDFSLANTFGLRIAFQECKLDYTLFLNRNLKETHFHECSLKEAHFIKCELTGAIIKTCNLELTKFAENNLTGVDFSTSYNIQMDPDDNKLRKAKFSLYNLPGLLTKHGIVIET